MVAGAGRQARAELWATEALVPFCPRHPPAHLNCQSGFLPGSASPPQLHEKITQGSLPLNQNGGEVRVALCPETACSIRGEGRAGPFWGKR